MNRYIFLAALCIAFSSCNQRKKNSSAENEIPQNLVFIIADDLTTTLGCYGHPVVQSPNIDMLAESGILFNHAYCNYSVCNPSRSSFLTGVRPETIGIINNRTTLQSVLGDRITLPNLFKQNDYHTIGIGKIFHSWDSSETEHDDRKAWDEVYHFETTAIGKTGEGRNMTDGELGWCHWMAANGDDIDQRDGQSAQKAVEFIKSEHEKPFFLAVGLHKPHDPFIAPRKYFGIYPMSDCKLPELPVGWTPPYEHTLPDTKKIFDAFSDQDRKEFIRSYYACTSFMDAQVGKIMQALKDKDLMKNTVIVFLGDHGYHLGEHEWWNKVTVYEQGQRAPFIVYSGDASIRGTVSNALIEFVDIYPTLASIFKLKNVPAYLEGESFDKVIKDPSLPFKEAVYATINRGDIKGRTVKTKQWRYTEWDKGARGIELYDQVNDPEEYYNIAADEKYQQTVKKMEEFFEE